MGVTLQSSGPEVELLAIEYRSGSDESAVRKFPWLKELGNITLKRGIARDDGF